MWWTLFWILISSLVTVAATVVVLNLLPSEMQIRYRTRHEYGVGDPQFRRAIDSLLARPLVGGNRITPLHNGGAFFPAMLDAIARAERTITFETFIYWSGDIGRTFADAFCERARAGVRVYVLLDWFGSKAMDRRYLKQMEDAGVEFERYHAPHWFTLTKLNNRTHRKLLICDGRVAFTGGVGIADEWTGHAQDPDHWRDTQYRVEGPAVAQIQAAFVDNWIKANDRVFQTEEFFPPLEPAGDALAHMFKSAPHEGGQSVRLMVLLSLAAAQRTVRVASAYFLPDDLIIDGLCAAAGRGVRVQVVMPGAHIDRWYVRSASRSLWGRLLAGGVELYEYQPTMYHVKMLVVDEMWASVGSTNLDTRSLRQNDEANLNVLDASFGHELAAVFDRDLEQSRRVTLEDWRSRPWRTKLLDNATRLLRSQL